MDLRRCIYEELTNSDDKNILFYGFAFCILGWMHQ